MNMRQRRKTRLPCIVLCRIVLSAWWVLTAAPGAAQETPPPAAAPAKEAPAEKEAEPAPAEKEAEPAPAGPAAEEAEEYGPKNAPATAKPPASPPGPPAAPANPGSAPGAPPAAAVGEGEAAGTSAAAQVKKIPKKVQLSFNNADIKVLSKWLSDVTGKSIYKNKSVNTKLTVMSTKKVEPREALDLVYKMLALEGVTAIETRSVIYLVPEKMASKVPPEFSDGRPADELAGNQVMVRIFELKHISPESFRTQIRGVFTDKTKVEVLQGTNKMMVTDYAENLRLMSDLIEELDVAPTENIVTAIITLKHIQVSDLTPILTAVYGSGTPSKLSAPGSPISKAPPGRSSPAKAGAPKAAAAAAAASKPSAKESTAKASVFRLLPDPKNNRLIITTTPELMEKVRRFIDTLDVQKAADVTVRVLPLRYISGQDLVEEIRPMYQKLRGQSVKDTIEISANQRSNSLIILSSEANFKAIEKLVKTLDTEEAEKKEMKSFPLKHADAEDVAAQLEELYDSSDSSYQGYYYWRYRSTQSEDKVRIVANRRRNEVMVIGPPSAIERIGALIKELDQPVDGETLAPRIFRLKFVSAFDVEQVLNQLFVRTQEPQRPYWYYDDYELEEDRDIGRLYGKVRITSEPYTNAIIVSSNSTENFDAVKNVLDQLDVPAQQESTLAMELKFASAVTVANHINTLYARGGAPPRRARQPQQNNQQRQQQREDNSNLSTSFQLEEEREDDPYFPWLGGQRNDARGRDGRLLTRPVSDLVGKVRVVPDLRTNSVIITTASHFFPNVLQVVEGLDIPTPQVLIEAKIFEIAKDDVERLGVRWSPDGSQVFDSDDLDNSFLGSGTASYREFFSGTPAADALRQGVISGDVNLDILIQFLRRNTDTRVQAEPRINVANNEKGELFVGSRVPFIEQSQLSTEGTRNDTFDYIDVGIILEVTPDINADGQVTLGVRVESSQLRPGVTLFGGAIIDTRNYRTELTVNDGQILVLGGIIRREETEVVRKVPLLGDIPLLGYLFKKKDSSVRDIELMVFLRPTVTRSVEDVKRLMEAERKRTPQIRMWEKQLEAERDRAAKEAMEE